MLQWGSVVGVDIQLLVSMVTSLVVANANHCQLEVTDHRAREKWTDVPFSQGFPSTQAPCSPLCPPDHVNDNVPLITVIPRARLPATLGPCDLPRDPDSTSSPQIYCLPPWMPPVFSSPSPSLKFSPRCLRRIPSASVLAWVCSLGHRVGM